MSILIPSWPAPSRVKSLVTLRSDGMSVGGYKSFNLASHVGDEPEAVRGNRLQLDSICNKEFGLSPTFHWLTQVHGIELAKLSGESKRNIEADASITSDIGQACVVLTADCLPLLLCDKSGTQVAAVHAGWRGLAAGVITKTVQAFEREANEILVFLGPAISQSAFQVGSEVKQSFLEKAQRFVSESDVEKAFEADRNSPGKYYADLYALAKLELRGLDVTQVFGGDRCTFSESDDFFSYRKETVTGRIATAIWIQTEN